MKKKWKDSGIDLTWATFHRLDPTRIIYDRLARRGTQAGILWSMTYHTLNRAFAAKRYAVAAPVKQKLIAGK
ncbi:MAG: hypothetical protein JW730_18355 [Anaerolineales bacterium]|nr:hypothetical protein [Anaerolineales bacterium]